MMAKSVYGILLILIGVLVSAFWTYPMWNDISDLKTQVQAQQKILDRVISLDKKREDIATKYNAISPDDLERLNDFFPKNADGGRLAMNLDNLSKSKNVLLKRVDIDEGSKITQTQEEEKYIGFPFSILVSGNYSSFLTFIKALESSRRIIDLDRLHFNSESPTEDGKSIKSDAYEYEVSAHTYWKK